jgi:UrcA family protein
MNTDIPASRSKHGAIALVAAIAAGMLASGQPAAAATSAPAAVQAITVVAPHVVRHKVGGTGPFGGPVEVLSLSRGVSYADLDLTTKAGVVAFEKRIKDTAQKACDQIEAEYPSTLYIAVPANQNCVGTAVSEAMPLADAVIAAAGSTK